MEKATHLQWRENYANWKYFVELASLPYVYSFFAKDG